ncbi:MAG: COX15/CtaA family protein [Vicinamibacterales bacterium]
MHRFAQLLTACTVILIAAGGMVTSTGSGLSVPDWPTTYGWNMFMFPLSKMVGGIRYEHGHRLIASSVGFLTIILAVWIWRVEPRRWVRRLGFVALGAVILQGLLGGLTVLLLLPPAVSIGHAGLAQIFFCILLTLAVVTSPRWIDTPAVPDDPTLRRLALLTTVAIYVQILLGATMRHTGAGLAIPTFPLAFGHLIPPIWDPRIAINFAHRAGAAVVTVLILATAGHALYHHRRIGAVARPAIMLLVFVSLQIALGGLVILTAKNPDINTAHVVNGAFVLGTSLLLTLRTWRACFEERRRAVSAPGLARSAAAHPEMLGGTAGARP